MNGILEKDKIEITKKVDTVIQNYYSDVSRVNNFDSAFNESFDKTSKTLKLALIYVKFHVWLLLCYIHLVPGKNIRFDAQPST